MRLNVRPMQKEDLNSVYSIELSAHRAPWSHAILKDCLLVGYDCRVLEIEEEGRSIIAGYIISRYQDSKCHVLNLCIAPVHQKKGLGQYLLQTLIDSLAATWINSVMLEVRPSNEAALALYKKMGFLQIDIKNSYYRDASGTEDAIVLAKII